MIDAQPRLFAGTQNGLGEGPLWCPERGCLWWIDMTPPTLFRASGSDGKIESWPLPKVPGCFGQIDAARLIVAFRSGVALLSVPDGSPEWLVPSGIDLGEERFNDGKVDRAGRFWLGTMDRQVKRAIGGLYCLDRNQLRQLDRDGPILSNGIGFSPDNGTLYCSDTFGHRIYAYDFDLAHGAVANKRVFIEVESGHGGPDGLTVDADGGVWSVMFERSAIHRYRPDGSLDQILRLPVSRPTSCTFGGSDLRTLFITTARMGLNEAALTREPWAGGVLAVDLPYQGLPEPRYRLPSQDEA